VDGVCLGNSGQKLVQMRQLTSALMLMGLAGSNKILARINKTKAFEAAHDFFAYPPTHSYSQ
jgi:hypothetical protein